MLNVAVTGGIASGKSTIAHFFSEKNNCVIDTDHITHQILSENQHVIKQLKQQFGDTIFNADNSINRAQLGNIIFNDNNKKKWLEALLHPIIFSDLFKQTKQCNTPYSIALVPLLYETQSQHLFDKIIAIDCDELSQITRLNKRNGYSQQQALVRIQSQASNQQRLSIATDVIANPLNTPLAQLKAQVTQLHHKFIRLSKQNLG